MTKVAPTFNAEPDLQIPRSDPHPDQSATEVTGSCGARALCGW
jgi:hypothetical protein